MYQHRHIELGEANGIGYGTLVAEVGQGHQNAVDLVAIGPEDLGAQPGLVQRFDGPVAGGAGFRDDGAYPGPGQDLQDRLPALGGQVVREEAAIAHDDAKRHRAAQQR